MPPKTEAAPEDALAPYTVAAGHTVDGILPGDTVDLNAADAKRFRDLGFILGEDGARKVATGGPAVNVEDGVQMTTVA
jgi:hypothetical protein